MVKKAYKIIVDGEDDGPSCSIASQKPEFQINDIRKPAVAGV